MFEFTNFFMKTILQEHEAHFCLKFKNKLRTKRLKTRVNLRVTHLNPKLIGFYE